MSLLGLAPAFPSATTRKPRAPFWWSSADLSTTPLSGQAATFARTGTGAGVAVVEGTTTAAAPDGIPQFEMWDEDADGSVYERPTLALRSAESETLYWTWDYLPRAMTGYVAFRERGTVASANAGVLHIGSATAATDPRFVLDSTGTYYRLTHDNGSATSTATLAAAPSTDDLVELRVVLYADGHVLVGQSINGATESTATDATTATLAAAWAGTRLYLNSTGSSNLGTNAFLAVRAAWGEKTMAQMRSLF